MLPTLLYACETWTFYQRRVKGLNHFHMSCLSKLLKIKWQDMIPNTEVQKTAGMQSVHTLLKLARLRLTGHVIRMPDKRLQKNSIESHKKENAPMVVRRSNTRTHSKPPLRASPYQQSRGNRLQAKWRGLIRRDTGEYEAKRISEAEQNRAQRKARAKTSPTELSSSDLSCSVCNRQSWDVSYQPS